MKELASDERYQYSRISEEKQERNVEIPFIRMELENKRPTWSDTGGKSKLAEEEDEYASSAFNKLLLVAHNDPLKKTRRSWKEYETVSEKF